MVQMMVCHSRESGNPDLLIGLDSASKPALSKAEWVRNDIPQSTLDKAIVLQKNKNWSGLLTQEIDYA
jgi:hypothetical protein